VPRTPEMGLDTQAHAQGKQEAHANRRVHSAACGADGRTDHILSIVKAVDKDSTLEMIILVLKPVSSPSMPQVCRISLSECVLCPISLSDHTTCVPPLYPSAQRESALRPRHSSQSSSVESRMRRQGRGMRFHSALPLQHAPHAERERVGARERE